MGRTRNRKDQSTVSVSASMPAPLLELGYQQITNLANAIGLAVPSGASSALIISEGAVIRWRDDGIAPTVSQGMPMSINGELWYHGNLSAIQFVQLAIGGVLNISYYG